MENSVSVSGRQLALELGADKVSVHKNGIEFCSPTPFKEWSEMTVSLQSPASGQPVACHGVVVACTGSVLKSPSQCGFTDQWISNAPPIQSIHSAWPFSFVGSTA